jgi:hypothetical protein
VPDWVSENAIPDIFKNVERGVAKILTSRGAGYKHSVLRRRLESRNGELEFRN